MGDDGLGEESSKTKLHIVGGRTVSLYTAGLRYLLGGKDRRLSPEPVLGRHGQPSSPDAYYSNRVHTSPHMGDPKEVQN